MLRFIVCEDNTKFIPKIAELIHKIMMPYELEYKVNKFTEYNQDLDKIIKAKNEQKIYILDVEIPEVSELEIASMIREEDTESIIIFLTSYPQYKNDVFYSRLLALDYIQKGALWIDRLEETLKYSLSLLNRKKCITFSYNGNSFRIELKDINYIEKVQENKKYVVYTIDGKKYPVIQNLKDFEPQLEGLFFRCHKSILVNLENIKYINYPENTITFKNNESAYLISNRLKRSLKDRVENL